MARYTLKGDQWLDKDTGEPVTLPNRLDFSDDRSFLALGDYQGYACPVTGQWVEGRAAHRENLKRTGCRILEKGEREHNEKSRKEAMKRETERMTDRILKEVFQQL